MELYALVGPITLIETDPGEAAVVSSPSLPGRQQA